MNENRFRQLVDTYGADSSRWPVEESEAAIDFLASSDSAKRTILDAQSIDGLLSKIDAGVDAQMLSNLQKKIESSFDKTHQVHQKRLEKPSNGILENAIKWLLPNFSAGPNAIWRPAMAACLPLVLGITIGLNTATEESTTLSDAEELALLAISPTSTEAWSYVGSRGRFNE